MPDGEQFATAIERAIADRRAGDLRRARQRLKNYLVTNPASQEARRLLADLYRADRYPDEAGRWGYLVENGATPDERAAYEGACACRLHPRWTSTYIRRGLHWNAPVEEADDYAAAMLQRLDAAATAEVLEYRREIEASLGYRLARAFPPLRGLLFGEWPPHVGP